MICGYIWVSTADQNTERQELIMKEYKVEKIFSEKVSGKNKDRPQLMELLNFIREGDVVVSDFSRLARNTADLLGIVEMLKNKNVRLISSKETLDTQTATGKLLLTVIGAIATFERDCLLERQREGILIAKSKGLYKGRKPIKPENFKELYDLYLSRNISTKTMLAKN